ncbi:MAG: HD domain-containing protein [Proteobacteria bacterium]|nr:HD domain-containing protein [Pseudomonadota bacterium]
MRQWDFERDGPVKLDGEWRFHWRRLEDPSTTENRWEETPPKYREVPALWTESGEGGQSLASYGYATMSLDILLKARSDRLALGIQEVMTAYRLHVNGKRIADIGGIGTTRETSSPRYRPLVAGFNVDGDRLKVRLQVSNFHHQKGGVAKPVWLGREQDLRDSKKLRELSDIFLIGSIFFMGIYHLIQYWFRKKRISLYYFGIVSCLIALRTSVTSERLLSYLFPGMGWEFVHKLEYLSFYATVPFFLTFIHSLFPAESPLKVLRLFQIVGALFSLVVVFTPARIYSHTVVPYQMITLASGAFVFYTFFLAWKRKREGAITFQVGFFLLFLTVVNDILYTDNLIDTGYLLAFGLFAFMLSQAIMLSLQSANAFSLIENQKETLMLTNVSYKKEIEERKKLEADLKETYKNYKDSRIATILGLAKLAEYRDSDTGMHLERMREYSRMLARELAKQSSYEGYITTAYIDDIYHSAILHDIGKVGIPDSILLKPGKLDDKEFDIMRTHSSIGGDALSTVADQVQVRTFLTLGKEIAFHHHEKWDGSGYPSRLAGDDIPLSARIISLADVYDALTSSRPYKDAFSHEKALQIITEGRGSHFDPNIVDIFLDLEKTFDEIRGAQQD